MFKVNRACLIIGFFLIVIYLSAAQENVIRVEISGLRSDKGKVMCALFSSAGDFPKRADKAVMRSAATIASGHAVCEFSGIATGTYAVSVIHDENSNGRLDTNFIGIPREGVGASNNAKGHFGPPKFDAASFRYSGGRLDLKITIDYL
jgi:uncharacterized protein (DUF2141 family)